MLIKARWDQENRIFKLSGRFDKSAKVPIETALAASQHRPLKQVILDMSNVSSIDSAGLGRLLLLYHSLRKQGVALTVCNPKPLVNNVLQMVNLATLIPVVYRNYRVRSVA